MTKVSWSDPALEIKVLRDGEYILVATDYRVHNTGNAPATQAQLVLSFPREDVTNALGLGEGRTLPQMVRPTEWLVGQTTWKVGPYDYVLPKLPTELSKVPEYLKGRARLYVEWLEGEGDDVRRLDLQIPSER